MRFKDSFFIAGIVLLLLSLSVTGHQSKKKTPNRQMVGDKMRTLVSDLPVDDDMDQEKIYSFLKKLLENLPEDLLTNFIKYKTMNKIPFRPIVDSKEQVPESFDSRDKWSQCKSIKATYEDVFKFCFSNWATTAAWVLTDRHCIKTAGKDPFEFSTEEIITCCTDCMWNVDSGGCSGGNTYLALEYCKSHGIVSGGGHNTSEPSCKPFSDLHSFVNKRPCTKECNQNYKVKYENDKRFVEDIHRLDPENATDVKREIMKNGPVLVILVISVNLTKQVEDERANRNDDHHNSNDQQTVGFVLAGKIVGWKKSLFDVEVWLVRLAHMLVPDILPIPIGVSKMADLERYIFAVDMKGKSEKSKSAEKMTLNLLYVITVLHIMITFLR